MTSTQDRQPNNSTLEKALGEFGASLSEVRKIVRGMYDKVTEVADTAEGIYDILAYRKDIPIFDPDNGSDLLDGTES